MITWIRALFSRPLRVRPYRGRCPQCSAQENRWCYPGCTLIDPVRGR